MTDQKLAVVAGAGGAMGPSLLDALQKTGYQTVTIARTPAGKTSAKFYTADLADPDQASEVCDRILDHHGAPSVFVYNAHKFLIERFEDISVESFEQVWRTDTLGGFIASKKFLPAMLENGGGTVIFSGATASVRGSVRFSAFASAKFALRGLAQSLAREFGPRGIHVAHVIIDGLIDGGHAQSLFDVHKDKCVSPEALANAYLTLISQPKSAWTHELDLRPFNGIF